jgi:diaminopimelate decarboxylase
MFGIKKRLTRLHSAFVRRAHERIPRHDPGPETFGLEFDGRGRLCMAGFTIDTLAATYKTPLFIINEPYLRDRARVLRKPRASGRIHHEVFFSYKTNPVPGFLSILHTEGIGAEVISGYELWLALRLGVVPDKIIFNGVGKTEKALETSVERDIRAINIDSFGEIDAIAGIARRAGRQANVGIRLQTGTGWAGQFGLPLAGGHAFEAARRIAATPQLRFGGLHFHLGTQLTSTHYYREALSVVLGFAAEIRRNCGLETRFLDIGGGYGVPTVRGLSERDRQLQGRYALAPPAPLPGACPSAGAFLDDIFDCIAERCHGLGLDTPAVFLEPGRLLSSTAQILVAGICDIKSLPSGRTAAIADAGINIAYPVLGEYRRCFSVTGASGQTHRTYLVVGPTCSIGDILYPALSLPVLKAGDCIAIMDAGAYFVPNANNFSYPRPAIIAVTAGGHRIVRTRESYEHMIANDIPADGL